MVSKNAWEVASQVVKEANKEQGGYQIWQAKPLAQKEGTCVCLFDFAILFTFVYIFYLKERINVSFTYRKITWAMIDLLYFCANASNWKLEDPNGSRESIYTQQI